MAQRVLLIDDSPQMCRLVAAWLKGDQIELMTADTGAQGAQMASQNKVDVILLDVDMPDICGFDLCRILKADAHCVNVPIIFLTGASSPEDRVRGLNLGATDYIIKPFHPAEFQARIRAALRTKNLFDLLQNKAQIDGLTALHNRAYLDQRLKAELASTARHHMPLSCVMIDVDNFKHVNDQCGHLVGDDVLRAVGVVLLQNTRAEDVVARYGGEEFVILTPGVGLEGAMRLAERIRVAIANQSVCRVGGVTHVTCSLGVATYDAASPQALVGQADTALYAAKNQGRNRVCAYQPSMKQRAA